MLTCVVIRAHARDTLAPYWAAISKPVCLCFSHWRRIPAVRAVSFRPVEHVGNEPAEPEPVEIRPLGVSARGAASCTCPLNTLTFASAIKCNPSKVLVPVGSRMCQRDPTTGALANLYRCVAPSESRSPLSALNPSLPFLLRAFLLASWSSAETKFHTQLR